MATEAPQPMANRELARTRRMSMTSQVQTTYQISLASESGKNISNERLDNVNVTLDREEKIEVLQKEFAKVASAYNEWLQLKYKTVEARFEDIDGTGLPSVEISGVSLADVKAIRPYKGKLDEQDKSLRDESDKYLDELEDLTEKLQKLDVLPEDDNKFTFFSIALLTDHHAEFDDAIARRHAAFEEEADRVTTAHDKFMEFCRASEQFEDLANETVQKIKTSVGELKDVLKECRATYNDSKDLNSAFTRVEELCQQTRDLGIVGTNTILLKVKNAPETGLLAVRGFCEKHIHQLDNELKLKEDYNKRAADLTEWMEKTKVRFSPPRLPNNVDDCEKLVKQLRQYRSHDKPAKERDLQFAQDLLFVINKTLEYQGRDGFSPCSNVTLSQQYDAVKSTVEAYTQRLMAETARQQYVANMVQEWMTDAVELHEWLKDKQDFLNSQFTAAPKSKSAARSARALLDTFSVEYDERMQDLMALEELGKKIIEENYEKCEKIIALYDNLCIGFADATMNPTEARRPPLPAPGRDGDVSVA